MTTPDPSTTPAPTDTPPTPSAPQTPPPTPPAQPSPVRASGADSSLDLMDAINALPEKMAATFQEMAAAKTAPVEPPKDTVTDTEKTSTVKKSPPKSTPAEVTPPRKRTFGDRWFGK